ncbi:MAG: purine-binding chemotaxis protein CheW [Blastocatellia bacterium]|jgi:chemotaxis signal transduction protein|nr:purine-binding chemotaxis protein CheW [Blastocatellia bacterium]
MTKRATNSEPAERERLEVFIVRAGERWLGLAAEEVAGVERGRQPTPLPHAPAALLGVVSVRGRILTLLDPLALLGERSAETTGNARPAFILALRGQEQLALAVESEERLREIFVDEIAPPNGTEAKIARGTFQDDGASVTLLDATRLFAAAVEGMEPRRRKRALTDER